MNVVRLIVQCSTRLSAAQEEQLLAYGTLKYRIPLIGCYVIEVNREDLRNIKNIAGVESLHECSSVSAQMNLARKTISCEKVKLTGSGVGVAILDTGVSPLDDFTYPRNRIVAFKDFVNDKQGPYDDNAHGTHVAGISAGNGCLSNGKYQGIAPEANIIAVKILDANGKGDSSDVLAGIQWIIDNKDIYNIRIANLSIGTQDATSHDPLVRAVEAAWDEGIIFTIAAGNNGPGARTVTSPGISRKAITVGASDDNNLVTIWGDTLGNFSGRGPTSECIIKPDIIAPGSKIISCLASIQDLSDDRVKELKIVAENYLEMSGTSMATPVISGAIALLLEQRPDLTPNEVKYLLKKCAVTLNRPQNHQGWGIINVEKLLELGGNYGKKI